MSARKSWRMFVGQGSESMTSTTLAIPRLIASSGVLLGRAPFRYGELMVNVPHILGGKTIHCNVGARCVSSRQPSKVPLPGYF